MGFNKKYITKEGILSNINNLDKYLNADGFIGDTWSTRFVSDLDINERKIRNQIREDLKYQSGCPDRHKDYINLKSLSESLLSLMNGGGWLDIHFTKDKLKFKTEFEDAGVFDNLKEKAIKSIIDYYDSNESNI